MQQNGEKLTLAKHVLVAMVQGILYKLNIPLDVSGDISFPILGNSSPSRSQGAKDVEHQC